MPFHVLNRAVGRRTIFESEGDYAEVVNVVAEALRTRPMRICGYCVMPNHWHMVLWPERDGELPAFVQHVSNLHVKRWKKAHREIGEGHLYQGRYKSFPIQTDAYFQTVIRYVERNPLRANLVARAEAWPWSSLGQASSSAPIPLAEWPVPQPAERHGEQWIEWVNGPQTGRMTRRPDCPDLVAGTFACLTNWRIPTNLANMINVNIHDAKTNLSALVRAVEERGETVILQRHGKPVAEIHAYSGRGDAGGFTRDLAPDPDLIPRLAPGYDPTESLAAEEWPPELR